MRVVISGFYGFGNMGDEAILQSMIDNLRTRWPDIEITVLSYQPEETAQRYKVESCYRGFRRDNRKKIKALKRADVLLSGGGGLLQDTYATKIVSGPLPYYLIIVLLAKLLGTKVMFFSQGIGPITSRYGKFLMRRIANKADFITVRDEPSKILLGTLGVYKPKTAVTADIVLAFQHKKGKLPHQPLSQLKSRAHVAISVRPWFDHTDYFLQIAMALDTLIQEKKIVPVFIPMEGDHDYHASLKVIRQMTNGGQCVVLKPEYRANELITLIENCQLLIGMRLHALIFSILAGTPFIGIEYDPKVTSFLQLSGMTAYGQPLSRLDSDKLVQDAIFLLNHQEDVKSLVKEKRVILQTQAEQNLDLFAEQFIQDS
ncbi:polysaccharide pyruvyl transferase CsaB [Camelliibacillus cellulosilyticus]|uniref:Polysaccharide pyruvyl transferase CsaB n=2 Tax=Camelliibacillus cellulosilyticus TaxID=2174486 RepID=A0ABV9GNK4_9BACL